MPPVLYIVLTCIIYHFQYIIKSKKDLQPDMVFNRQVMYNMSITTDKLVLAVRSVNRQEDKK